MNIYIEKNSKISKPLTIKDINGGELFIWKTQLAAFQRNPNPYILMKVYSNNEIGFITLINGCYFKADQDHLNEPVLLIDHELIVTLPE
jgi:hypothetical protein